MKCDAVTEATDCVVVDNDIPIVQHKRRASSAPPSAKKPAAKNSETAESERKQEFIDHQHAFSPILEGVLTKGELDYSTVSPTVHGELPSKRTDIERSPLVDNNQLTSSPREMPLDHLPGPQNFEVKQDSGKVSELIILI
jgi:hypothetical protein